MKSMSTTSVLDTPDAEWEKVRDNAARHFLNVSAAGFVERYKAGEYADDVPGLMAVLALFSELD